MKKLITLILLFILFFNHLLIAQDTKPVKSKLEACIDGQTKGDIPKSLLLAGGKISCTDSTYKIICFKFSGMNGSNIKEAICKGNSLTNEASYIACYACSGSKVYFENIIAEDKYGKRISLPSMIFRIL